jgi:hypothetical protein
MLMFSRKSFALHSPSSNPGSITDIADRRLWSCCHIIITMAIYLSLDHALCQALHIHFI